MNEQPSNPPPNLPPEDPVRRRRAQASSEQLNSVTFARKGLTQERLDALAAFLKHAKADEIAAIRGLYGDMPEVLKLIGLEVLPLPVLDLQNHPD